MADDFVKDLPTFVVKTEQVVNQLVIHKDFFLPEELRELAEKAWIEFGRKERHLPSEARDLPTVIIDKVGLSGDQWEFKMAAYNLVLKNFREKRNLTWLKKLLGISDELLGSLVQVLTIAEPLNVMVENLSTGIDITHGDCCEEEDHQSEPIPDGFDI